ncbi:MAG: hypothetical protein H0V82_00640 [Candidatus Protochlamydia sp.]|nr:hypothetical protein [Candidatus Protochlamydia sp.]
MLPLNNCQGPSKSFLEECLAQENQRLFLTESSAPDNFKKNKDNIEKDLIDISWEIKKIETCSLNTLMYNFSYFSEKINVLAKEVQELVKVFEEKKEIAYQSISQVNLTQPTQYQTGTEALNQSYNKLSKSISVDQCLEHWVEKLLNDCKIFEKYLLESKDKRRDDFISKIKQTNDYHAICQLFISMGGEIHIEIQDKDKFYQFEDELQLYQQRIKNYFSYYSEVENLQTTITTIKQYIDGVKNLSTLWLELCLIQMQLSNKLKTLLEIVDREIRYIPDHSDKALENLISLMGSVQRLYKYQLIMSEFEEQQPTLELQYDNLKIAINQNVMHLQSNRKLQINKQSEESLNEIYREQDELLGAEIGRMINMKKKLAEQADKGEKIKKLATVKDSLTDFLNTILSTCDNPIILEEIMQIVSLAITNIKTSQVADNLLYQLTTLDLNSSHALDKLDQIKDNLINIY